MNENEILSEIEKILKNGDAGIKYKIRWRKAKKEEFGGWYIDPLPREIDNLWVGYLNYPKLNAKGIFIAALPSTPKGVFLLSENDFHSFPFWGQDTWFYKRLISEKNTIQLNGKKAKEMIRILLQNTYPFSD